MPGDGLSLVGFMDEQVATAYLKGACIQVRDPRALWLAAKKKRGDPVVKAGACNPQPLPDSQHLEEVKKRPHFSPSIEGCEWSFKLVELDNLIAFQFHVDLARSKKACEGIAENPSVEEMLPRCLPLDLV